MNSKNRTARLLWPDAPDAQARLAEERAKMVGQPCHCCGITMTKPQFDHDHETQAFRGWLCKNCNTGLGKLGDNIAGLERALRYLKGDNETTY